MCCAYAADMKGLIAVDLDGTLLDSSGKVSPRNIKAIGDLRDAGFKVVPATGRSWRESRRVFEVIQAKGMAVTSGGSVLSDAATGKTIERLTMDPELVLRLTLALLERGLLAHLLRDHDSSCHDYCLVGTGHVNPATEWWLKTHEVDVRRVDTIEDLKKLGFDHVLRVGAVERGDVLAPVCAAMREQFQGQATMQSWSAVTSNAAIGSETHLLEMYCVNTDKWTMIQRLRDRHGLSNDQVFAIGDGLNDLIMVREAGVGIAMQNAHAELRPLAKHIAPHHHEDGFAHVVEQILSGAISARAVRSAV